jgi:hypothetical protein
MPELGHRIVLSDARAIDQLPILLAPQISDHGQMIQSRGCIIRSTSFLVEYELYKSMVCVFHRTLGVLNTNFLRLWIVNKSGGTRAQSCVNSA